MVVFNREYADPTDANKTIKVPIMYVASGSLHWYAKDKLGAGDSRWDSAEYYIKQPEERDDSKVIVLAATNNHLYALCIIGMGKDTRLWRIGPDKTEWEMIEIDVENNEGRYSLIQSIFADKEWLFAGVMNNNGSDYGILYLDDTSDPTLRLIAIDTGLLSGAASRNNFHYLSTRGDNKNKGGIFIISETELSENKLARQLDETGDPEEKNNRLFMGMIKLNDQPETIIAVERTGGTLFEVQDSGFRQIKYSNGKAVATGKYSTGALALWQQVLFDDDGNPQPGTGKRLVAGIQGGLYSTTTTSSYSHGYVEFELNSNGSLNLSLSDPNISPNLTVHGFTDRYKATIGKHPINFMYQTPKTIDDKMIFFASTQTAGLWSYRDRPPEGFQWNAEK